jgi:hypothetical protein
VDAEIVGCDIETGCQPDDELLRLYSPPPIPEKFDPSTVDLGRATKPETVAKKIAAAKVEFELARADPDSYLAKKQAEWLADTKEDAAKTPLYGRVLAIGTQRQDGPPIRLTGEEAEILEAWWAYLSSTGTILYAFHNGDRFDLPFLTRRSWVFDVTVPEWVYTTRGHRIVWNPIFLDTMLMWTLGEHQQFIKLDTLARRFGFEGKLPGCDGKAFDRMYHGSEEEKELALAYLDQDVNITLKLALKLWENLSKGAPGDSHPIREHDRIPDCPGGDRGSSDRVHAAEDRRHQRQSRARSSPAGTTGCQKASGRRREETEGTEG